MSSISGPTADNMKQKRTFKWKWVLIPAAVIVIAAIILLGVMSFLIKQSQEPAAVSYDPGDWIELHPEGIVSADGEPVYTEMRIGAENKTLVIFYGGGICCDPFTAFRPFTGAKIVADENGFYTKNIDGMIPDYCELGIASTDEENPFHDWTVIIIPYATGDFHLGMGDHVYTDPEGNERTVRHHGYINYRAIMDEAMNYTDPAPDELLIVGYSAGGFGAAALTDDLIENYFSDAGHVSVCVDSSLLIWDGFQQTAAELWEVPDEISDRLISDNPLADLLTSLYGKYGDSLTYMYIGSVRDGELVRYQNYFYSGKYTATNALGRAFTNDLRKSLASIKNVIPGFRVYLFDRLPFSIRPNQIFLTQHTITVSRMMFWRLTDGVPPAEWLYQSVYGDVWEHGLNLLF